MSVFDSIKQMFNNKDDSQHKHYKKGDYKSLVAETMNSLDELEGVKMDNSYVSPYEKRDFANSVEIVDKDPKAESFSRHAAQKANATKINKTIPKQTEDSFANMMKKTVNSPENQMAQNPISKEDSFSTLMKKKVNSYKEDSASYNPQNSEESENRDENKNIKPERESRVGQGLIQLLENRNKEQYATNKENMDLESLIPKGEEWKSLDEIYILTNVPVSNNEMSIETIIGMSSKMSNMPMELRKNSILSYLASKNIDPMSIIEESEIKSKSIDKYEKFLENRINKRKNRIESEIELLQKKILERQELLANDEQHFSEWKNEKKILEDMMKEACECLGKSDNDRINN